MLAAVGCSRPEGAAAAGTREQILHLGNGAEPQDIDPQTVTAFTDQCITLALFEGLCALDEESSQAVPAAAESWKVSPDGLVYTFRLREGLQWSNGEPLTAGDFVQSWRRTLSPTLAAEYSYLLFSVKNAAAFNAGRVTDPSAIGLAAPDERTIVITLERPTPFLPALTAQPAWFPINPRLVAKFDGLNRRGTAWTRPENFVGNGPFILTEWTPHARLSVKRNSRYWDSANTHLNGIVFYPTENRDVEERNFRAGQLHLTYELPLSKVDVYRRDDPSKLRLDPFLETFFLRFNVNRPPLDDPRVRAALSRSLDRESIARNVLRGSRQAAYHYTPPNAAGYTARARIKEDADAARQLLAAAGFPGGQNFPTLEIQIRNDELHGVVAEVIQAMWKRELGINLTLAPMEQKAWVQNQQSLNYSISTARWVGDFVDPVTFLDMFVGGGSNNWTGWSDPNYDRFIESAAVAASPADRAGFFQQAEARLLEAGPIAPVFFGTRSYLIHPDVKGWAPALLGFHQYKKIRLER